MAAKIASSLNELFSSNLTTSDWENLSSLVEDYFCFDSDEDSDGDDVMQDSKYIHYFDNQ